AKIIENISQQDLDMGIRCITFLGSSIDNLTKRPIQEKLFLLDIYERYFKKLMKDPKIQKNKIGIRIIGRWREQFPGKLKGILEDGIKKTADYSNNFLNFLLAYDGSDDMLEATRKIVKLVSERKERLEINEQLISDNLLSSQLPSVDLIIRTGTEGDPHNSAGFLMWQTRNSQYYFTDKLFPDFDAEEFASAIKDYQKRSRRFGK
ncbi:MAG: polyprenyl diphosphate synthase, partial [Candidatus Moranbacteria bacterium]|nr:polyprenyl diphosphate synthase [Candidatus Moranbacteria bacterium]